MVWCTRWYIYAKGKNGLDSCQVEVSIKEARRRNSNGQVYICLSMVFSHKTCGFKRNTKLTSMPIEYTSAVRIMHSGGVCYR